MQSDGRRTDARTHGRTHGRTDGRTDGQIHQPCWSSGRVRETLFTLPWLPTTQSIMQSRGNAMMRAAVGDLTSLIYILTILESASWSSVTTDRTAT